MTTSYELSLITLELVKSYASAHLETEMLITSMQNCPSSATQLDQVSTSDVLSLSTLLPAYFHIAHMLTRMRMYSDKPSYFDKLMWSDPKRNHLHCNIDI